MTTVSKLFVGLFPLWYNVCLNCRIIFAILFGNARDAETTQSYSGGENKIISNIYRLMHTNQTTTHMLTHSLRRLWLVKSYTGTLMLLPFFSFLNTVTSSSKSKASGWSKLYSFLAANSCSSLLKTCKMASKESWNKKTIKITLFSVMQKSWGWRQQNGTLFNEISL